MKPNLHSTMSLASYVTAQIDRLIPDGAASECESLVAAYLPEALARTQHCIDQVKMWPQGQFNYLHSSQYCIFLYYLSNSIWRATAESAVPTRLFLLNKALNGIDIFYEIQMPNVFFIGHSVGIVLAKARYGEYLALYQNSTIGRTGQDVPTIGDRVVIYPHSAIVGRSNVADGSVLSYGTRVINASTAKDMVAYNTDGGELLFKPQKRRFIEDFFRL